jgi:hypothetical protein
LRRSLDSAIREGFEHLLHPAVDELKMLVTIR